MNVTGGNGWSLTTEMQAKIFLREQSDGEEE
jgi:hypothetical protein